MYNNSIYNPIQKEVILKKLIDPPRYLTDQLYLTGLAVQGATAIYFLLEKNNFSAFHRIKSDECWHFYTGDSLLIHVLNVEGEYQLIKLGADILKGEVFQAVVPAGAWFASETNDNGLYSFVGCTVAPGFDFADFELASAEQLTADFPTQEQLIKRLCRS